MQKTMPRFAQDARAIPEQNVLLYKKANHVQLP